MKRLSLAGQLLAGSHAIDQMKREISEVVNMLSGLVGNTSGTKWTRVEWNWASRSNGSHNRWVVGFGGGLWPDVKLLCHEATEARGQEVVLYASSREGDPFDFESVAVVHEALPQLVELFRDSIPNTRKGIQALLDAAPRNSVQYR